MISRIIRDNKQHARITKCWVESVLAPGRSAAVEAGLDYWHPEHWWQLRQQKPCRKGSAHLPQLACQSNVPSACASASTHAHRVYTHELSPANKEDAAPHVVFSRACAGGCRKSVPPRLWLQDDRARITSHHLDHEPLQPPPAPQLWPTPSFGPPRTCCAQVY